MHTYDGERNTVFLLSGGAGRIITAIPALEKYARLNPDDDFKVLIYGWESLYWNHPLLQDRTFSANQKGIFDLIIKTHNLYQPEPYHRWTYYNQQKSLVEAFDEEINNTQDHSDLEKPNLYLHSKEIDDAKNFLDKLKDDFKRDKIVVIQPFGAAAHIENDKFIDPTQRSIRRSAYLDLIRDMPKNYGFLYFGPRDLISKADQYSLVPPDLDLRAWMSLISQSDYFVGVDSVGQHMARALEKKGLIVMGSTFEKNVSYPDYDKFTFYRNENARAKYSPIRIGGMDSEMADRLNEDVMKFSTEQVKEMKGIILKELKGAKSKS